MIIIKCKSFRSKRELAAYEREFNRKIRQGDAIFLPADFEVVHIGPEKPVIIWDEENNHVSADSEC